MMRKIGTKESEMEWNLKLNMKLFLFANKMYTDYGKHTHAHGDIGTKSPRVTELEP
jgi:hypothetical protein